MGLVRLATSNSSPRVSPEKLKRLLAMMMIVALMPETEASREVVVAGHLVPETSGATNYLSLFILVASSIAVWELLKGMIGWFRRRCCCGRTKEREEESPPPTPRAGTTPPPSPTTALPRPRRGRVRPAARNRQNAVLSKVVMTPNGTCAHSSKECSTLNISQELVERKLCTVCCRIR